MREGIQVWTACERPIVHETGGSTTLFELWSRLIRGCRVPHLGGTCSAACIKLYPSSGIREKHGMTVYTNCTHHLRLWPWCVSSFAMLRTLGVCIPVYRGAVGFLPLRKPVHLVLGAPLELSCQVPGKPTDEEVQQAHARYMEALLLGYVVCLVSPSPPKNWPRKNDGEWMSSYWALWASLLADSGNIGNLHIGWPALMIYGDHWDVAKTTSAVGWWCWLAMLFSSFQLLNWIHEIVGLVLG